LDFVFKLIMKFSTNSDLDDPYPPSYTFNVTPGVLQWPCNAISYIIHLYEMLCTMGNVGVPRIYKVSKIYKKLALDIVQQLI